MDEQSTRRVIQQAVSDALTERSSVHPIVSVDKAVTLAMARCRSPEWDRPRISQLVCETSLRQRLVLAFGDS